MNFYSTTEWNTPWKFKITPENLPKGKDRLPSIIFFRGKLVNSLLNFNRCGQNDSKIIFSSWSNRGKVPWDYHQDNPITSEWPCSVGFAFFKVMKLWRFWPKSPILRLQLKKSGKNMGEGNCGGKPIYHEIICQLPSGKLTWQWKMAPLKMYSPYLNMRFSIAMLVYRRVHDLDLFTIASWSSNFHEGCF